MMHGQKTIKVIMCVTGRILIDAKIKTPIMKTPSSFLTKVPEAISTAV
jgi:hypothetical protein